MKKQAKAMHRTARITSVSSENHALLVGVSDYEPHRRFKLTSMLKRHRSYEQRFAASLLL